MINCVLCEYSKLIDYSPFIYCTLTDKTILPDKIVYTCPVNKVTYNEIKISKDKVNQALETYKRSNVEFSGTSGSSYQCHLARLEGMKEILIILGLIKED